MNPDNPPTLPHHELSTRGVGPWPEGDQWDQELLATGDSRNVADHFRYWTMEAIVAELDTKRHAFHVAIENWQHDLNIGSIVRTANAFLADTVHIVGRRRWNRRGAMVTDRYQHVMYHEDAEAQPKLSATSCSDLFSSVIKSSTKRSSFVNV